MDFDGGAPAAAEHQHNAEAANPSFNNQLSVGQTHTDKKTKQPRSAVVTRQLLRRLYLHVPFCVHYRPRIRSVYNETRDSRKSR